METKQKNIPESQTNKPTTSGETSPISPDAPCAAKRPVWETIVEIGAQIPQKEWTKVPEDATINYKHYLYGAPKKKV